MFTVDQRPGAMLFGITGVTVEGDRTSVMVLGAESGVEAGTITLQLIPRPGAVRRRGDPAWKLPADAVPAGAQSILTRGGWGRSMDIFCAGAITSAVPVATSLPAWLCARQSRVTMLRRSCLSVTSSVTVRVSPILTGRRNLRDWPR